jgi:hypothetical protein
MAAALSRIIRRGTPLSSRSFSREGADGMAEAKRKLAAILAADVAGYSRLMGDDDLIELLSSQDRRPNQRARNKTSKIANRMAQMIEIPRSYPRHRRRRH